MDISFANSKLKKLCEDHKQLKRTYGNLQSERIIKRINELHSAENLLDISKLPQARLHHLTNNLKGLWVVDIVHPYRMLIKLLNGSVDDLRTVTKIEITELGKDYH